MYFLCFVSLVLSRINHTVILDARDQLADFVAPFFNAASVPIAAVRHGVDRARDYGSLFGEVDRLKAENESLKQRIAELEAKLAAK